MRHSVKCEIGFELVTALEMKLGEIAVIVDEEATYRHYHIMRAYEGWILLENPYTTWSMRDEYTGPSFKVRLLPVGSVLTITVGGKG